MKRFLALDELNLRQRDQYNLAIVKAFPPIIAESVVIKKNWGQLESAFPQFQKILISSEEEVIGFINTIPFYFNEDLNELPEHGWDWMLEKGISDFENNNQPNLLGGLQVIVRKRFQKLGYSKRILEHAKGLFKSSNFMKLVIPIRPTKKHEFPEMSMTDYLNLKVRNEIFDPWIRTHLKGGAQIIKICEKSMTMKGDIKFWEGILNHKIEKSGSYQLEGALELVNIDLENNHGEYIEPNIWIKYN